MPRKKSIMPAIPAMVAARQMQHSISNGSAHAVTTEALEVSREKHDASTHDFARAMQMSTTTSADATDTATDTDLETDRQLHREATVTKTHLQSGRRQQGGCRFGYRAA
jgi:hypothetical protein